ncbi:hypothetical protein M3Y97_01143300 [Aphelenchoides bicaudatus]|nr:hypothetical protein M3Y97_01143300 [Aphelenchoides bicaudatus]
MPELMVLNDKFIPYNPNLSQSNRSLDDCLQKTGAFLSFLADVGLVGAGNQAATMNSEAPKDWRLWSNGIDKKFPNNNFHQQPPIQPIQQQPPIQPFSNPPQDSQRQHGQLFNSGSQPRCEHCGKEINGSFVLATGKTWCPEHFTCANVACNRRLLDCGFVEESGKKYCEKCFETLIAPICAKCGLPITADCLNALQKQWHPECFVCVHCRQTFGNTAFYLENGQPYCEKDWNQLFTTKCVSCKFPIEAGDRWIEAIGSSFHSNCFNCFSCQVNLEGQNFYARDGHPFCRAHA